MGQIEGLGVTAGWANVSNNDIDGIAVVGVGDTDGATAVLGLLTKVAIPFSLNGTDEVTFSVNVSASTSDAILHVPGGLSSVDLAASAASTIVVVVVVVAVVGVTIISGSVGIGGRVIGFVFLVLVFVLALFAPREIVLIVNVAVRGIVVATVTATVIATVIASVGVDVVIVG